MASTPPDILKHKMFSAPDTIRAEVDSLIIDLGLGSKAILSRMLTKDPKLKGILPSVNILQKYINWRRENPLLYAINTSPVLQPKDVIQEITRTVEGQVVDINHEEFDYSEMPTEILHDNKKALEFLKNSVTKEIFKIQQSSQTVISKYELANLISLFKTLKELIHSDIKLAEDLKDTEQISVGDVKLAIEKLFDAVYLTVDRIMPEQKEPFKVELEKVLQYYQSNLLEEIALEETHENI